MAINTIAFSGGGARLLSYCGALDELNKKGILKSVKNYAGTSSGSIIAMMLAAGYTIPELTEFLKTYDFTAFQDNSYWAIGGVYSLLNTYGYFPGDVAKSLFDKLVKDKLGNSKCTFKQLYDARNIELAVVGCNINRCREEVYSYKTTPNLQISLAVRASMAVPLMFTPVKIGNDYIVDGGLLNIYPLYVFDPEGKNTIGMKLVSSDQSPTDGSFTGRLEVTNLVSFVNACYNTTSYGIDQSDIASGKNYWDKTIVINTGNVDSNNYNLSAEDKEKLIGIGRKAALEYVGSHVELIV